MYINPDEQLRKECSMHPLQTAYDFLMEELKVKLVEVSEAKKTINQLAKKMGVDLPFSDVNPEELGSSGVSVRIDEFVNKAPSTALQEYLTKRGQPSGAVTWNEIVDVFKNGGFDFSRFGGEKAVRMTLIKNTTAFKFIRKQNAFGLKAWYGNDQKSKKKEPIEVSVGTERKRGRPAKSTEADESNSAEEKRD